MCPQDHEKAIQAFENLLEKTPKIYRRDYNDNREYHKATNNIYYYKQKARTLLVRFRRAKYYSELLEHCIQVATRGRLHFTELDELEYIPWQYPAQEIPEATCRVLEDYLDEVELQERQSYVTSLQSSISTSHNR